MNEVTEKIMFMDGTDFLYELGDAGSTVLFSTIEELNATRACAENCGIVAVKVQLVEWLQQPTDIDE